MPRACLLDKVSDKASFFWDKFAASEKVGVFKMKNMNLIYSKK